jgi:NTP pyrophosphatase (non-canonical NTP hydrolase)
MEFSELQKGVTDTMFSYGKQFNIDIDKYYVLTKLLEEVGELAQAVLIHQKKCRPEKVVAEECSKRNVAKELADVVGMAIVAARVMDINLEEAMVKKWIDLEWVKKRS